MGLNEQIRSAIDKTPIPIPIFYFQIFGISFFIYRKSEYYIEAISTAPYELDGETPLLDIHIGRLNIMFENEFLYRKIYTRKRGYEPLGLLTKLDDYLSERE